MKLRLDLHIHTKYSFDGFNTPKDIVRRLREQGLDGYAVTDHDTLEGIEPARAERDGLVVLPGLEVTAQGAHVLALQPTEPIPRGLTVAETVDIIHAQGATAVLAHPYGLPRSWVSIKRTREAMLDAIEVCNAAQFPYSYIRDLNEDLAKRLGLPRTGGSDSHIPETVGRAYTIVDAPTSEDEEVVRSILKGHTTVHGSGITITERIEVFRKKIRSLSASS